MADILVTRYPCVNWLRILSVQNRFGRGHLGRNAPCTYSQCDNAPERALHLTGEEEEKSDF